MLNKQHCFHPLPKNRQKPSLTHLLFSVIFFVSFACTPTSTTNGTPVSPTGTPSPQNPSDPSVTNTGANVSATPAGPPKKVTTVEGITEYLLSNGLRVLLFPDNSKPTVTINVTYFVGSRHEAYGETGMAHLLEHLVFKGTPNHPNISEELTAHGSRANGTTWLDRTNYYETVPATDENLTWALDMEADRMVNSFIAKKDLDSEMTVVRNELESGENNPFGILLERTLSTAYLWHNYGKSTIGARSDLENVPIERLQAFYKRYYQPDNAMLIVAGKFDPEKTLAIIQEKFGSIPRPERSLNRGNLIYPTYTAEPTQDGERTVTLRRVGDVQVAIAAYHLPAGSHKDFPALEVLGEILGDEPSGRLHKSLVEKKKASSTGAFSFQLREPGILLSFAQVRQGSSLETAKDLLIKTVEGVATKPPTKEEVDRAKTSLLKQVELTLNSSQRIGLGLTEWAAMGDWRLLFLNRDRLEAVTVEDVQRVAKKYFKSSNRTLGLFIPTEKPERAEIPKTPDVNALVKDYKGKEAVVAGEEFDPSPANIESRTTRSTLPGGLELALLPKKTRGNTVYVNLALRFGSEKALSRLGTTASMTAQMLMRGTKTKSRQEIQDEFDKLKARVTVFGGGSSINARIETTRPNLIPALKLLAEVLKNPSFNAKEFDILREESLANLEEQKTQPQTLAFTALQRHLSPYSKTDIRYIATVEEDIANTKAAKVSALKKFYSGFYGASKGELAVVGDFAADELTKVAGELFGSWKSPKSYKRIPDAYQKVSSINKSIETPDKANAVFAAGINLQMSDADPDYPAMLLANYIIGGGFLNSRLATRIRQKDGLSYGVGSFFGANAFEKNGTFGAFAIYAPENVDKLEKAFKEEIEKVLKDGFTDEEVKNAKSGFLQQRLQSRANDNSLAGILATGLYTDRTLAFDAELEKKLQALTKEDLHKAVKNHIDLANISIIKAGDFTK